MLWKRGCQVVFLAFSYVALALGVVALLTSLLSHIADVRLLAWARTLANRPVCTLGRCMHLADALTVARPS